MKIWQVGVSDCESTSIFALCTTKEIALREMFKKRDELIMEWKKYKKESESKFNRNMYGDMIKALSHDDYKKWNNFPDDTPWICETEVIES